MNFFQFPVSLRRFDFIANNEDEMLRMLEEKKIEMKMKKWLETPVEAEKTDMLKEHDLVV